MNFQFYAEKLKASKNFKKFAKENRQAFPCSCFFIIDKEEGKDKQHFDFFIPSSKKILSFPLEENAEETLVETKDTKIPTKISIEHNFDFDEIEKVIGKRMEEEKITNKIQKMLFSLQNVNGKDMFIATIFVTSFGLINAVIDVDAMKINDFKKKSFFDMMTIFKKDK
jgi:hypothetical protein